MSSNTTVSFTYEYTASVMKVLGIATFPYIWTANEVTAKILKAKY